MTNREPGKAGGFGQNPQGQEHGDRGLPDQNAPKATERNSNYMKASDAAGQNPPVCTKRDHRAKDRIALEVLSICATPAILVVCALVNADQTALLSLVVVLASLGVFFATYESSSPRLRDIMPTVVLAALAAAGRILFAPIPDFKPVSAIAIIAGVVFGRKSGFMVGALAALASNFFFGQGPWTPWQMFAMGFIGFLSGILYRIGLLPTKRLSLCIYGFLVTVFIYGGIMNPAALFMSVYDFTWEGLLAIYISGIPVDLVHASSTFIFLWIGAKPLLEKLQRIKIKYDLMR